ncbi:uncharacterized protein LOC124927264 [Impatiens glandulifera]|uniref:uncharacterized protein LOC124927264 n=1 Tax=Impatiens glandulifera TaxID=253017 RepID=UPI001FB19B4C|nr:uncharacterized protein LOC124927264 [Impatiens glandulifera]
MAHNEKPLMLESEEFADWKIQMYLHLITMDDEIMTILKEGPIKIEKEKSEWTAKDRRRNNLDNHCMRHIFKSLDRNTFGKVRECKTGKEVWEKLIQLFEGSEQIKENQKEQKALMAAESKGKLADSVSDDSLSRDSDHKVDTCFTAKKESEVFDLSFDDFTRDDLIVALNDMVIKYRKLSESLNQTISKSKSRQKFGRDIIASGQPIADGHIT